MENDLNLTNRPNNNYINDIATSVSVENMVRFGKKESAERRQLLASMNSMHYNSAKQIDNAAFQHVRDNVEDLSEKSEANETDLVFLQGILQNPAVTQMIKGNLSTCRKASVYNTLALALSRFQSEPPLHSGQKLIKSGEEF
ncbi:AAEL009941-PA [Aedes aegypti]|uniref:AAEL009941-PA n=1 Tax=Aedes aegypti TaxID=7159 RepID=Q16UD2_AEDAE|nr:AAEL009941-PA [Aedes aegypti]